MQSQFDITSPPNPGQRINGGYPVDDIAPVEGWHLFSIEVEDGDGFWKDEYFARGLTRDVKMHVSRFAFHPTQERFAFLVRAGFPGPLRNAAGIRHPWHDDDIDLAIAGGSVAA